MARLVDMGDGTTKLFRDNADEQGYYVQGDQYGNYDNGFQALGNVQDILNPPTTNDQGQYKFNVPTDVVDYHGMVKQAQQDALAAIRSGQGVDLGSLQTIAPGGNEIIPGNPLANVLGDQYDSIYGTKVAKDLANSYGKALGYSSDEIQKLVANHTADTLGNAWAQGNAGMAIGETPINHDLISFLAQQKGVSASDPSLMKALGIADTADKKFGDLRDVESNSPGFFKGLGQQIGSLGPVPAILATIAGMPQLGIALMNAAPAALQGNVKGAALSLIPTGLETLGGNYLANATSAVTGDFAKQVAQGAIKGGLSGLSSGNSLSGAVKGALGSGLKGAFGSSASPLGSKPEYTSYGDTYDSYDYQNVPSPPSWGSYEDYKPTDFSSLVPDVQPPGYNFDDLGSGVSSNAAFSGFNQGLSPDLLNLIGSGYSGSITDAGLGLHLPANNNLPGMGGGQGLTTPGQGTDRFTGQPTTGSVGQNGYQASIDTPVLGNPTSFINDPNKVNVTPAATPPTLLEQLSGSGSLPKAIAGLTGALGSLAGSSKSATASASGAAANPWLDTSDELIRNMAALRNKTKDPTKNGLQQIYSQIDPSLTGKSYEQQELPTYAMGGSACANIVCGCGPSPFENQYQPFNSSGNVNGYANGGLPEKYQAATPKGHKPEFITGLTGYYACGGGTGQSDDIPAMLHEGDYVMDADVVSALGDGSSKAGMEVLNGFLSKVKHSKSDKIKPIPAKIADGEYVFPESFVTALGGGDNSHGSIILDGLREKLREHKRSAPNGKIPPKAKSPLDYIKAK